MKGIRKALAVVALAAVLVFAFASAAFAIPSIFDTVTVESMWTAGGGASLWDLLGAPWKLAVGIPLVFAIFALGYRYVLRAARAMRRG